MLEEVHVTVLSVAFSGVMVAISSMVSPAESVTDALLSFTDETAIGVGSGIGSSPPLVQAVKTRSKMVMTDNFTLSPAGLRILMYFFIEI